MENYNKVLYTIMGIHTSEESEETKEINHLKLKDAIDKFVEFKSIYEAVIVKQEMEYEDDPSSNDYNPTSYYEFCKYAKFINGNNTLTCDYQNIENPIVRQNFPCPKDSGTNHKCNGVCYSYRMFGKEF